MRDGQALERTVRRAVRRVTDFDAIRHHEHNEVTYSDGATRRCLARSILFDFEIQAHIAVTFERDNSTGWHPLLKHDAAWLD